MSKIFDERSIKIYKLPLWKRIVFYFIKPHIGFDIGSEKDKSMVVVFKKWRGVMYLVDQYEVGKDL